MKTPSFLILVCFCLLLPGACRSRPSSTSAQHSGGDSPGIDSSRSGVRVANPSPVARDSSREAPDENYDTLDPATRSHFRDVQAFLDLIKRPNSDYNVDFNTWIRSFRIGNIDSFLNFIITDSLEIDDAGGNPGDSLKYSRTTLRGQLTKRKGAAFDMIGEISLHYSIPYPQYSHPIFSMDKKDSVPNLKVTFSEFALYFRAENGNAAYKLYRLESDHIPDL
ncbi:MAG TPA: hypothetical protein VFE32_16010 [Puia sp.]|jgi:hypothetical protein|nr:hypothetical protein [Puia sp.]